ncbi:MAG: hypothetical protein COZ46_04955 [Verrucomicrobia bacterium CG_4_10_14_3_um_filter_43_23]|nr:MAG: hypothetical protein AUJ82_04245 [Verrucomicrobia bacterium CG1_02_43_26]PIP59090.1 MAG: hypothetical protein COX01_05965 [Verrucomicrobia bacterium CG22_combo_CG10-13_8_21_14_all_43_17]PIX58227.1 MAG: hypothetical protein COZ46_04955 [Verrucomicrobia bacterium CG_4_10_14_3_um_filter_43_23]PIY62355.1 MAG: hypothetical protein COY94_02265 [Verrucomicrobia bacterium CG_4_10_14_0_8_um_filter_43_34]PJA44073.1 MAG: hypothetical protein CO175_04850 [Verrucomicrobia bacterium CG_4_9_14_3_um_fi
MEVIGSVIARLGSKRLPYKNILPIGGKPMVIHGVETLLRCPSIDLVVVSTESELIEEIVKSVFGNNDKVVFHRRPKELAEDNVPSMPVFRNIIEHYPARIHVNYNYNLAICEPMVIERAIELAREHEEALSVPYAAWAQTKNRILNYEDPWKITAHLFQDSRVEDLDIHTEADLLKAHKILNKKAALIPQTPMP